MRVGGSYSVPTQAEDAAGPICRSPGTARAQWRPGRAGISAGGAPASGAKGSGGPTGPGRARPRGAGKRMTDDSVMAVNSRQKDTPGSGTAAAPLALLL